MEKWRCDLSNNKEHKQSTLFMKLEELFNNRIQKLYWSRVSKVSNERR